MACMIEAVGVHRVRAAEEPLLAAGVPLMERAAAAIAARAATVIVTGVSVGAVAAIPEGRAARAAIVRAVVDETAVIAPHDSDATAPPRLPLRRPSACGLPAPIARPPWRHSVPRSR